MNTRRLKRFALGALFLAVIGLGSALAIPTSRHTIVAYFSSESPRSTESLLADLKHSDANVRRQAALHLGDIGILEDPKGDTAECQRVLAGLIETMGDQDDFVRKCAATSLLLYPREGKIAEGVKVTCLLDALSDKQVVVRQAAARALWQTGGAAKESDGVNRLAAALDDKNDFVRAYVARALARIGPDAKAGVPALLRHLQTDEEQDIRKLSAKALGLIGPQAIGELLPDTVKALTTGLAADARGLREYAARALGELGAREAIAPLQKATKDRDAGVRAAATEALKRLDPPPEAKVPAPAS